MTVAETNSARWEQALVAQPRTRGHAALRAYGEAVNRRLLARWLPARAGRALKTDLFEEALGEGLASLLRSRATAVSGVDVSQAVAAAAASRHEDLAAERADVRRLPFPDDAFDLVVSTSTLDHLPSLAEVERALGELHRVIAPGGTLVLTHDNRANPLVWLRSVLPWPLLRRLRLVPHYVGAACGPRRLRGLVAEAGFTVERETATMHVPRLLVLVLGALLPRQPLLALLVACERLERLPTRYLTGQFAAVRAAKR